MAPIGLLFKLLQINGLWKHEKNLDRDRWTKYARFLYKFCMKTSDRISNQDRSFFHLLSEAAATNPFSDDYRKLQLKIADCDASIPPEERLQRIVARAGEKVRKLESEGRADIRCYGAGDRELLRRYSCLTSITASCLDSTGIFAIRRQPAKNRSGCRFMKMSSLSSTAEDSR